jgi:WD40 repeat protein
MVMNNIFNWLNIAEYILIIITLITLVISINSGNLAIPLFFLTMTVLVNLINRLSREKRQRNRFNYSLKKLNRQLESLQEKIDKKEISVPPPPLTGYTSPEVTGNYQEYLASLEKSLTNVVQYLNNLDLDTRIEYLEKITSNLATNNYQYTDFNELEKLPFQEISNKPLPSSQNWHCVNTLTDHNQAVTALALTPDGKFLASGGSDRTLKLWSLKDGKLIDSIIAHEQALLSLILTNYQGGNYYLITGSYDQTINFWTLSKDKNNAFLLKNTHSLTNHTGSVHGLAIAPQHNLLISGSYDQTVKQWDLTTGKLLCSSFDSLGAIYAISLHQQRKIIASAGADGSISLWQLRSGELLGVLSGNVSSVESLAISPDGQTLAAGCVDGNIRLWNLSEDMFSTKNEVLPNRTINAHFGQITSLIFGNDGEDLFSSGADGKVKVWHLPTLSNVGIVTINDHNDDHHNTVLAIALSGNGELLTVGSIDGKITIWLRDD